MPKIILHKVPQRSSLLEPQGGTAGGSASALLSRVLSPARRARGGDRCTGHRRCWSHVVPRSWTTWGLFVDVGHAPHPVAPAEGLTASPGRYTNTGQLWPDVPVIMLHKFQQICVAEILFLKFSSSTECWTLQFCYRDGYAGVNCTEDCGDFQGSCWAS